MPLSPRHAAFVAEYLANGLNATKACLAVGYVPKNAESQGSRLLKHQGIKAAIAEAAKARADKLELEAVDVLRELKRIGLSDIAKAFNPQGGLLPIHEMPEDFRRAIASVEVDELWGENAEGDGRAQIGVTRKLKLWNKPESLVALGKYFKLFVEKVEVAGAGGGPVSIEIVRTIVQPKEVKT